MAYIAHAKMINVIDTKETEIKTTGRYHFTPTEDGYNKKSMNNNKNGKEFMEKWNAKPCWKNAKMVLSH